MAKKKSNGRRLAEPSANDIDLDAWAESLAPKSGCKTCSHSAAAETIRGLLRAIIRADAQHITLRQIHQKLGDIHPDYSVGYYGFRSHLRDHERELWHEARGKD